MQNQCLSAEDGYWISAEWLMTVLVWQGLKQASMGECILKAMKLNSVIPPLLFGLSAETPLNAVDRSWDMLSPMMKLRNINSQDGWRLRARLPQEWVHAVCSR